MLMEPLAARCEKKMEKKDQFEQYVVPLRRELSKSSQRISQKDNELLLDDPEVSFTSKRISQIYRPYSHDDVAPNSPQEISAPIVRTDDV